MTYQLIEVSEQNGSPRLLFIFTFGNQVWRRTTEIAPIVFNSETYTHAQIDVSPVVMSTEIARDNIVLTMPIEEEPGPTVLTDFENVLTVSILRGHLGDPDGEFITFWKGRAMNFQVERQALKIHCEPIYTSLRRPGLNSKYQRTCRWSLYGRGCWVDMEDFAFYTKIAGPAAPVVERPKAALIYVKGSGGVETWNRDQTPYVLMTDLLVFPDSEALSIGHSARARRLFIGSNTRIHRYNTATKPYAPLAPIPASVFPNVLAVSPDGRVIFYGEFGVGPNYLVRVDSGQTITLSNDSLMDAVFDSFGSTLVVTRAHGGVGAGIKVYAMRTWPPILTGPYQAEDLVPYSNAASGARMVASASGLNQLFVWGGAVIKKILSTSINVRDMIYTPDNSRLIVLTSSGLIIYDTGIANEEEWGATIPINGNLATNNAPDGRKILSVSADSRYFALWQKTVAGPQRIVFDLSTTPVQRVPDFDNQPAGANFLSTQLVEGYP